MPQGRKPNWKRRDQVAQLAAEGLSFTEIGRRLGISRQLAFAYLYRQPSEKRRLACRACGRDITPPRTSVWDDWTAVCPDCLRQQTGVPFGVRLRSLRLAADLTLTELAAQAGVTIASLTCYERRRGVPTLRTLKKLATVLPELTIGSETRASNSSQQHLIPCGESIT